MYYLRADQRGLVRATPGNVNPNGREALALRFRFPWPDEDATLPGEFQPYERALSVPGFSVPEGVEHYSVQFSAHAGYLVSLPCPEGADAAALGLTIHRNGFGGAVQLVQQKLLADGRLVPVCRCGGCGAAWRVEEAADIEALAVAFRAEADRRERLGQPHGTGRADRRFYDQVADRILVGARLYDEART
jgi:hypothetical protein